MRRIFLLTLLACALSLDCAAQEKPVAEPAPGGRSVDVSFKGGGALPASFVQTAAERRHYTLVELEPADEPGAATKDRTAWLNASRPAECRGFDCKVLRLNLDNGLRDGQTFILAISDFTDDGRPVTLRFTVAPAATAATAPEKAEITTGPDAFSLPSQLQLRSKQDITVTPQVIVKRVFFIITPDGRSFNRGSEDIKASVTKLTDRRYVLDLQGALVEGKEHFLAIEQGITDATGRPVMAEGKKVKLPGLPTKPDEMRYNISIASNAAVHQKPIFELTANLNPYNPDLRPRPAFGTEWLWEPTASVDVGLRSTKSANSVILAPFNFSRSFTLSPVSTAAPASAPTLGGPSAPTPAARPSITRSIYANWLSTPWYRPSDLKLTLGPKAEFDRTFKRKNLLGSVRFDLSFHRWLASIKNKRNMIKNSFDEEVGANARLRFGMSVMPYAAFDFGGHVNNETVTKKVKGVELSAVVPKHKILRGYLGFKSVIELPEFAMPLTLTIEEALVYLGARETIGFTNDEGAFLRQLRGLHHRGKASLSFGLDPSRHYNFELTYENGRQAPNFEYLNKTTAGIKIIY